MKNIYLDYAAATPISPEVLAAMQPYWIDKFYNPSAQYTAARDVAKAVVVARAQVAHWFGARPSEIIFTAGGTEANNLAIHGIMREYPDTNIVVSAIEHEAVLAPASEYEMRQVPVTPDGVIDLAAFEKLIDERTVLVSIMYANNEVGTIQPIKQVAQIVQRLRRLRKEQGNDLPLWLHSDACQAAQFLDLHAARLGVDMMTINAGKMYGPKQAGALYVNSDVRLLPQILGGGQERGMRSGTEAVANVIGLAVALDRAQTQRHEEAKRLQELQRLFIALLQERLPSLILNGSRGRRLPNNVHVTIPDSDNERLMIGLDEQGIVCAAGSACSASNEQPSHVLRAMGKSDQEARSSLRFTMGVSTDEAVIHRTVESLHQLIA